MSDVHLTRRGVNVIRGHATVLPLSQGRARPRAGSAFAVLFGFSFILVQCGPSSSQPSPQLRVAEEIPAEIRGIPRRPHVRLCNDERRGHVRCHARAVADENGVVVPFSVPPGFNRTSLLSAYNLPSTGGSGVTVALIAAFDNPNAEADLGTYRAVYSLSDCTTANGCFKKVNQNGQQSGYPSPDPGWATEIALDTQAVSAICPSCNILLVEANSADITDVGAAVGTAVALGAKVVSNSYGVAEGSWAPGAESIYNHPGVAIFASTGDNGYGVEYPAVSQYVIAVGGTSLAVSGSSRGWVESTWGSAAGGSGAGSGCSAYVSKPAWQTDETCSHRVEADVSADADPNTGIAIYDSYGQGSWILAGGTSLSTPLVAAMYALIGRTSDNPSLSWNYPGAFYDVTSGANGPCGSYYCEGRQGYDGPTGNGTPNGQLLQQTFTVGVTPAPLTLPISSSAVATVGTTLTGGASSTLLLTASGLPLGVTALFAPSSLTVGGASVLTFTAAASAPAGSYSVTVTGSGASRAVSTSLTLNVQTNAVVWTGVPANRVVEASTASGTTVSWTLPTATQESIGLSVSCSPAAGSAFPLGTTSVTCSATDQQNHVVTRSFSVTVTDTTAPSLQCPADVSVSQTSVAGATPTYPSAVASDAVSTATVTYSTPSGATFALGTTPVNVSATDAAGNTSHCTFQVQVTTGLGSSSSPTVSGAVGCTTGGGHPNGLALLLLVTWIWWRPRSCAPGRSLT